MKNVFLLHGLKRSGNHAIVNWLMATTPFAFFNNIIPMAPILHGKRSIPPPVPLGWWLAKRHPIPFWGNLQARGKHVLLTLEDHSLAVSPFTDLPYSAFNMLVLRDPYNLFASRIRKASLVNNPSYATEPGPLFDRAISLWKDHAREFLGDTHQLENKVTIYYNAWFRSVAYRRSICDSLDLEFSDAGLDRVTNHGGGSSFDLSSYDNKATQMDVLNRASHLNDGEKRLFGLIEADGEIAGLHARIKASMAEA